MTEATLPQTVQEVQGTFPNDASLQDAIGRLTRLGFDRAALSLPAANPAPAEATPEAGAANPDTEDDTRQARTLQSSLAASAAAMVGAGVTVATGGAAAIAAAAAVGLGAAVGGGTSAALGMAGKQQTAQRDEAGAGGTLVLSATAPDANAAVRARAAMQEAGATRVESVERHSATIATGGA